MKNVFIDAQIWLSLYDFSSDDLEQFRKLNDLIDQDVKIYLTQQVYEEVKRNRENKIKESLSKFRSISIQIPNLCKGYDEYRTFKTLAEHMQNIHRALIKQVESDIQVEKLHADYVINEIFEKLKLIERSDIIINKATIRYDIGNPPGKEKSYGDAINWITLLETVPDNEELFFISSDKDFRSVIDDNKMNKYLYNEWKQNKKAEIYFYKSLTDFFKLHLKDIELKTENSKNLLIEALGKCVNFARTHHMIKKLSQFSSWSDDQAIALLQAAANNNQVYGIIKDGDINTFFKSVLEDRIDKIYANEELHWILDTLGYENPNKEVVIEDVPF